MIPPAGDRISCLILHAGHRWKEMVSSDLTANFKMVKVRWVEAHPKEEMFQSAVV